MSSPSPRENQETLRSVAKTALTNIFPTKNDLLGFATGSGLPGAVDKMVRENDCTEVEAANALRFALADACDELIERPDDGKYTSDDKLSILQNLTAHMSSLKERPDGTSRVLIDQSLNLEALRAYVSFTSADAA